MTTVDYITPNPEFTQEALDRTFEQFKKSDNILDIIRIVSGRYANLFNEAVQVPSSFLLGTAVGSQLAEIGDQLKIERRDYDDSSEAYRAKIRLFASTFRSGATRDEIYAVLAELSTDGDARIFKGKKYFIEVSMFSPYYADSRSGGEIAAIFPVTTELLLSNRTTEQSFGFNGSASPVYGFGTTLDETTGGVLSSVIYQTNQFEPEG